MSEKMTHEQSGDAISRRTFTKAGVSMALGLAFTSNAATNKLTAVKWGAQWIDASRTTINYL